MEEERGCGGVVAVMKGMVIMWVNTMKLVSMMVEVVMVIYWRGDGEEMIMKFGKEVVEIMELGDEFTRRKNMEEVELMWKKTKKRRGRFSRNVATMGGHGAGVMACGGMAG